MPPSQVLGSHVAWGLLLLHGFSGSAFRGIGKKTAWTAWHSMPHLTPCEVSFVDMAQIE